MTKDREVDEGKGGDEERKATKEEKAGKEKAMKKCISF